MFGIRLDRFRRGEPITAAKLNGPLPAVERAARLRVAPPLTLVETALGPMIGLGTTNSIVPATATTSISARSSGSPGTGSATLDTWNGTSLGTGTAITVRNRYGTSITTGAKLWVVKWGGAYWLLTAEC